VDDDRAHSWFGQRDVFTAGLGLDSSLDPVRGVVPALLTVARAGCARAAGAAKNAAEAAMPGPAVVPCPSSASSSARKFTDQ
jgi:predicted ATPase with chaperone activity